MAAGHLAAADDRRQSAAIPPATPTPTRTRLTAHARSTRRSAAGCTTASACTSASSRPIIALGLLLDRYPSSSRSPTCPTPAARRHRPGLPRLRSPHDRRRREDRDQRQQVRRHRRRRGRRRARRERRRRGLDAYWLAQHPAGSLDALTALADHRAATCPTLALGVGVVPVWGRHPAAHGRAGADRGPGRPRRAHPRHRPLPPGDGRRAPRRRPVRPKPLGTMREYLEVLVPLVTDGKRRPPGRSSTTARRPWRWRPSARPTVLVAAMGEQMLELAGRLAHGTITSWTGPNTLRDHVVPTDHAGGGRRRQPAAAHRVDLPGLRHRRRRARPASRCTSGSSSTARRRRTRRCSSAKASASASDVAIVGTEDGGAASHPRAGRDRRHRPRRRRGRSPRVRPTPPRTRSPPRRARDTVTE